MKKKSNKGITILRQASFVYIEIDFVVVCFQNETLISDQLIKTCFYACVVIDKIERIDEFSCNIKIKS